MTEYCIPFEDCSQDDHAAVGGKNASLGELVEAGVPVPPGFAISTSVYEAFLHDNELDVFIDDAMAEYEDGASASEVSDRIQIAIKEGTFSDEIIAAILESWEELRDRTETDELSVAVRSSATAEDLPDASFAGQHDTYLNVTGFDELLARTKDCMASLFTERAIGYRAENEIDQTDVLISVGIQRMVDAEKSGVMFTVNTANGDRSKILIESTWGLGEAVVSGKVTPDNYLVDKPTFKVVDKTIANKEEKMVASEDGIELVLVEEDRQEISSLEKEEIKQLTELGKNLERHYGTTQDIEWVVDKRLSPPDNIFIVQSRPETTWG